MQSLLHHFLFYAKVHPTFLHANIIGILFLLLKFHLIFYIQVLKPLSRMFCITFKNADIMRFWYGGWLRHGHFLESTAGPDPLSAFSDSSHAKRAGLEKTIWSATLSKILIPQTQISMLLFRIMKRGWEKGVRQMHSRGMKCWQIFSFQILSCVSWMEHEQKARSHIHWVILWFTWAQM